jgi:hypothetical protein
VIAGVRGGTEKAALVRIYRLAEEVRKVTLAQREAVDRRNEAIKDAVDRYQCSQRQVARASGLSLGRICGVLAND